MKTNTRTPSVYTHEEGVAQKVSAEQELRRTLMTCLLWESTFYEPGSTIATRLSQLVTEVKPEIAAKMAIEARQDMLLRHAPLFLARELARIKGNGPIVAKLLPQIIQRADELTEFVALYWREKRQPLSAGVKKGLAFAFRKFSAYDLAKYNRDGKVKLRDVLFLCHAKPINEEQAQTWKRLVEGNLEVPDTWEVALSAAIKNKKEIWERLLKEGKLGGLAVLRNLRNMELVGVDRDLIKERLSKGITKALPFRFISAARHAPHMELFIEAAMLEAVQKCEKLDKLTLLVIDVSGSMEGKISKKSEITRIDAACGLAILLRETCPDLEIATFSNDCVPVPARRGLALRDAIYASQPQGGTYLARALEYLRKQYSSVDRIIVITDEQSHDGNIPGWGKQNYVVNVAPYKFGLSYGNHWTHIDGWSERIVDYIRLSEL